IFSPFCAQAIVKRLACTRDLWKRLLSPEWDASIDHDAGIAAVVLSVVAHRVERRTPAPMNDIDLIARVAARAHRPYHVFEVGRSDVIVAHDGPAVVVGPGMAMRTHHTALLGMAAVKRLDRDHEHEPTPTGFMRPHPLYARNARRFELVPHCATAIRAKIIGVVIGRYRGNRAHEDRIVSIHQCLDADCRLEIAAARVISGPFAEGPLLDPVIGMDETLKGDLRIRRHR